MRQIQLGHLKEYVPVSSTRVLSRRELTSTWPRGVSYTALSLVCLDAAAVKYNLEWERGTQLPRPLTEKKQVKWCMCVKYDSITSLSSVCVCVHECVEACLYMYVCACARTRVCVCVQQVWASSLIISVVLAWCFHHSLKHFKFSRFYMCWPWTNKII